MLKIAIVIDDSLDSTAGVQQYVMAVGRWMSEAGHTVHYLTSETKRTDIPNIYSLAPKIKANFNGNTGGGTPLPMSTRRAKKINTEQKYDVLHIQMPYSPFLAGKLIKTSPSTTAVVGTFHIFPESNLVAVATSVLGLYLKRQLKRFDSFISVSSVANKFSEKTFKIESAIIPNMFDIRDFDISPKKSDSKTITIVYLGRLVPRKGPKELLEAINYIKSNNLTNVNFRVVIGGRGSMLEQLKQYSNDHGLNDNISFAGFVAEEDKGVFLNKGDISVFPSTGGESFGISLLEAMAATSGTVIAGDNEGYKTVMGDLSEQLVDPKNIKAFAELLVAHIKDKSARDEAMKRQRNHVKQYDRDVVCKEIEATYYDALRKRRS